MLLRLYTDLYDGARVFVCTSWFHECERFELARQQHVMQVSVAAVECDVPHVAYHNVLNTNIVLPEMRKEERHLSSGHKDEKKSENKTDGCENSFLIFLNIPLNSPFVADL